MRHQISKFFSSSRKNKILPEESELPIEYGYKNRDFFEEDEDTYLFSEADDKLIQELYSSSRKKIILPKRTLLYTIPENHSEESSNSLDYDDSSSEYTPSYSDIDQSAIERSDSIILQSSDCSSNYSSNKTSSTSTYVFSENRIDEKTDAKFGNIGTQITSDLIKDEEELQIEERILVKKPKSNICADFFSCIIGNRNNNKALYK